MRKVWVHSSSALAVVVAAVALAACGSSSSNSSSSSATSSAAASSASGGSTTSASSGSASNSSFVPTGSGGLKLIGSGGTQASESNDPLGIKAQTGTAAGKQAITDANTEAAKLGSGTIPKGTNIGLEEIINSVPSAQRADGQLIYALRELGFNVIACDAEGDPGKMESCMTSLVSQNVKAIVSLGTDPSLIAQGLQDAKSHKIPVISFSGAVAPRALWSR